MMENIEKLLTKRDLAQKLQVTERSIDNWIKEGVLKPCSGLPVIRFSPKYVAELEGVKLEKFSPLEKIKLERKLDEVTKERDRLQGIIARLQSLITEAVYIKD